MFRDIYIIKRAFWVPGMDPQPASSNYFGTGEPFKQSLTHSAGSYLSCFSLWDLTQPWAVAGHLTPACLEVPTLAQVTRKVLGGLSSQCPGAGFCLPGGVVSPGGVAALPASSSPASGQAAGRAGT